MKKKIVALGIIAMMVVVVFVMTSCDPENNLDAPSNVVATRVDNSNTHITWNWVSGARYYTITFRTNLDSGDVRRPTGGASIAAYTHSYWPTSGVHTLYYYVKAQSHQYSSTDGYKESGWAMSNSVSVSSN